MTLTCLGYANVPPLSPRRILREEDCNFLCNLSREEYAELRSLVVDMVLATDMSSHFQQIKCMKNYVINSESA